jgi:hypothetical protein
LICGRYNKHNSIWIYISILNSISLEWLTAIKKLYQILCIRGAGWRTPTATNFLPDGSIEYDAISAAALDSPEVPAGTGIMSMIFSRNWSGPGNGRVAFCGGAGLLAVG